MQTDQKIIYHIYPLGFCAVEEHNDFQAKPITRINKITNWLPHIKSLGCNTLLLGPIWESSAHGYDTADYLTLDRRLGNNADFKAVADSVHQAGMLLVLDGVFNHVGRDFFAFSDVKENKQNSAYKDWFSIDFGTNNAHNDGFSYHAWEGCDDLVTLNLNNPGVRAYLLKAVEFWIKEFDIDGLRLDVAYCLNMDFMQELRDFTLRLKPDFWLMGEVIKGNYRRWLRPKLVDSVTNYECWKGLWSSCNTHNMFEIAHSLDRQFGEDAAGIYKGYLLYNFAENHDVSRLVSTLKDSRHLPILYTMLYTIPGIPSLYYGGEWGVSGRKTDGDKALRRCLELREDNKLTEVIKKLSALRERYPHLADAPYQKSALGNEFLSFFRNNLYIAVNIGNSAVELDTPFGKLVLPPVSAVVYDVGGESLFSVENFLL